MEETLITKIEELEKKVERVRVSVEAVRKYFMWSLILTLAFFLLPLIGLIIVIPRFIASYSSMLSF